MHVVLFNNGLILQWCSTVIYDGLTFVFPISYKGGYRCLNGAFSIEGVASRVITNYTLSSCDWLSDTKRCYMSALVIIGT